ncbi:nuclear receptor 2C2-associated protein [Cephus cinctus]|uniref:Nuclear receptor 2C2-associated protein n=1 Tax=Cephus cinctus TaxID=211228 RepID=A0AAJ7BGA4_CEPCN|nr:nuclear receptor 2C2-associated protein [Cephus cinctus]XP_015585331.1 nuclear receptor 2C2-associated protein [Cephus cinctus]XP_015585332.1 nuclear receptor 2C2-associated protein [Cephus cinctus]XP_015585333.1 nuclear receptor 2C2-associated protein [Cephus cinctus]XP_024936172.1 nuclear receptor 2C2-associated protein [Cephus cinctus]XP_024936173.1 nuclear receptor 2C2-associated protein [Cephus cinctus]XP_024936174.1 nuclear receptor 2C2-associated protein [Cephus cinctus]
MSCLLKENKFECRVSSVLNKDIRHFGKKYMFDDCNETCWNSDSGIPQWIIFEFDKECSLSTIEIEFQGGFVGKDCFIEAGPDSKSLNFQESFFPEDTNTVQKFKLNQNIMAKIFKLVFKESTDFFGRIIIYKLSLYS